jgi:DNA repair exonuclease SbcCD ATPase subunit
MTMADTLTISLAKALKLKSRLAGRVTKLTEDIKAYNSVQDGAEAVDVKARFAERAEAVARLTDLKAAISRANLPIQKAIFELAERKAEVALLNELPTKNGVYQEGYPTAGAVTYVAQLRKADVDARAAELEAEIDRLQDRLDEFNHETTIAVDPAVAGD